MNELFRELEEEINQEKFERIWGSFGRAMVWASIAVVALTVVFVVWQNRSHNSAEQKTSQFLRGIDRLKLEDYKGAIPIFAEIAKDTSSPYYGLAMLRKAKAEAMSGDSGVSKSTLAELAGSDSTFADIGKLGGEIGELDKNSPFYFTLAEYKGWQLLKADKKTEAADVFAALAGDSKTPPSIADRAEEALHTFAPEKIAGKSSGKDSQKTGNEPEKASQ